MNGVQIAVRRGIYSRVRRLSDFDAAQVMRYIDTIESSHEPNEETLAAIEESFNAENLIECEDFDDMLKKCEIKCYA